MLNKTNTNTLINLLRSLKHSINQDQIEETDQKGSKLSCMLGLLSV